MSRFQSQQQAIAHLLLQIENIKARLSRISTPGGALRIESTTLQGGVWPHAHDNAEGAGIVEYSPTTLSNWNGNQDPGNIWQAIDQLAARIKVIEGATGASSSQPAFAQTTMLMFGMEYTGPSPAQRTNHIPVMIAVPFATWTNQPAALTEIFGGTIGRLKALLNDYSEVRLHVNVLGAGAATPAKIRGQYSTDDSTYAYFDGSSEPSVDISSTGRKVSSWIPLPAAAKADVFLRVVGIDGDAAADPSFGIIAFEFRG